MNVNISIPSHLYRDLKPHPLVIKTVNKWFKEFENQKDTKALRDEINAKAREIENYLKDLVIVEILTSNAS